VVRGLAPLYGVVAVEVGVGWFPPGCPSNHRHKQDRGRRFSGGATCLLHKRTLTVAPKHSGFSFNSSALPVEKGPLGCISAERCREGAPSVTWISSLDSLRQLQTRFMNLVLLTAIFTVITGILALHMAEVLNGFPGNDVVLLLSQSVSLLRRYLR